jgi:hypothetical protein
MNNRDLIKKAIKKLVLQEIANNQFGTPIQYDKKDIVGIDALNKSLGKDSTVMQIRGTGKTMGATKNQEVQLNKNCDACYDVVSVTNESERKIARGVSLEVAMELVKKHAGDSEKTYVQKAYDKSLKGFGKKPAKVDEKKENDTMDDADEELQIDIADDNTEKADVKADKASILLATSSAKSDFNTSSASVALETSAAKSDVNTPSASVALAISAFNESTTSENESIEDKSVLEMISAILESIPSSALIALSISSAKPLANSASASIALATSLEMLVSSLF